ncbi:MAG TPA: hypothetical protein VIV57_04770, partial [Anaeromyxobacter sp.]
MRKPADVKARAAKLKRRPASSGRIAPAKGVSRPAGPASALDRLDAWLEAKKIEKAKIGGFDVDGVWRGKYVSLEKLRSCA